MARKRKTEFEIFGCVFTDEQLSELSPFRRDVFIHYYRHQQSLDQIGQKLNFSRQRARQLKALAESSLKVILKQHKKKEYQKWKVFQQSNFTKKILFYTLSKIVTSSYYMHSYEVILETYENYCSRKTGIARIHTSTLTETLYGTAKYSATNAFNKLFPFPLSYVTSVGILLYMTLNIDGSFSFPHTSKYTTQKLSAKIIEVVDDVLSGETYLYEHTFYELARQFKILLQQQKCIDRYDSFSEELKEAIAYLKEQMGEDGAELESFIYDKSILVPVK